MVTDIIFLISESDSPLHISGPEQEETEVEVYTENTYSIPVKSLPPQDTPPRDTSPQDTSTQDSSSENTSPEHTVSRDMSPLPHSKFIENSMTFNNTLWKVNRHFIF